MKIAFVQLRATPVRSGFSLIEVVLALGIISFAIIGIMGLFPVAMKTAQDSQRETRAKLIAEQISTDLKNSSGVNRSILTGTNSEKLTLNVATASTNTRIYYDESGMPLGVSAVPAALYMAQIAIYPNNPMNGLTTVRTVVQSPVTSSNSAVASYSFVRVLNFGL